jgi:hypothetical protein
MDNIKITSKETEYEDMDLNNLSYDEAYRLYDPTGFRKYRLFINYWKKHSAPCS